METIFLRGAFVSIWDKKCQLWQNARDTLIAIDDIKRIKACYVYIHDPVTKKDIRREIHLVCSAVGRIQDSDREVDCYVLTDPVEVIAEAVHRPAEELQAMLLELEAK